VTFDPLGRAGQNLKLADKFFDLARSASTPFLRTYYERVAQRYLLSEGELEVPQKEDTLKSDASIAERGGT
jgi:hypothetical protein